MLVFLVALAILTTLTLTGVLVKHQEKASTANRGLGQTRASTDSVPTVKNIASYKDLLVKEPVHSVEEANADFWLANGRQGIAGQVRI